MMTSEKNEALRLKGWGVFRSSSRDRVIPGTGSGAHLQRIKIGEALPVSDVVEGVAVPLDARSAVADARARAEAKARAAAADIPLGVSRHIVYDLVTQVGNPDPLNFGEESLVIGIAPFDGFLTEMFLQLQGGGVVQAIAFRTTTGQSVFSTRDYNPVVVGAGGSEPDMLPVLDLNFTPAPFQLSRLKVPVYAGEEITAVVRLGPAFPPGAQIGAGVIGFEGFILARPGSAAASSQFGSLTAAARSAATEAARAAGQLAIEREKTRRATEVQRLKLEEAKVKAEAKVQPRVGIQNPFQQLLTLDQGQEARKRQAPTPPPPPKFDFAGPSAADGKGKTFVQAWNPTFGYVGYLIPNPPPGGRVNVFDGRYTIWSAAGQNMGQGPVEWVRTDADIPESARVSRNLGTRPSAEIPLAGFVPGVGWF